MAVKAAVVAKVMPVVETVDSVAAKVVERWPQAMEMPAVAKVATAVEGEDSVVAVKVAVISLARWW